MLGRVFRGSGKLYLCPLSRCHVDCVTWSLRDACYGPRHFPCLSPPVIDLSRGGLLWFATQSDPGLIDIKIIKDQDTPSLWDSVHWLWLHCTKQQNDMQWNHWKPKTILLTSGSSFVSKMPLRVKARRGHGWVSLSTANYDDLEPILVRDRIFDWILSNPQ